MLKDTIYNQIELINKSLEWIQKNKPSDYRTRLYSLSDIRRKLRVLYDAESDNPAIAAFGESQKGKSYLMTNLLKMKDKPFEVVANGQRYEFVDRINPMTNNTEATSVVTRFTSFQNDPNRYNAQYPVIVRTLSIVDVITILTDSYRNDLHDSKIPSKEQFDKHIETFVADYADKPDLNVSVITEDDVLDLGEYINTQVDQNLYTPAANYLNQLLFIIRKVGRDRWADLFSILWNNDSNITGLFNKLLDALVRVDFSRELYIPIEAVLNSNNGTILSVECLKKLYDPSFLVTDVMYKDVNGISKVVSNFSRAELCAICREVIFKIEPEYLDEQLLYCPDDIADPTYRSKGPVRKDILKTNDLLDFPGARTRGKGESSALCETSNLVFALLRGKVAYLFSKYSRDKKLNILMFCHDHAQPGDTTLPIVLNSWIKNLGDTKSERKELIDSIGVSPLFVINTKFNCNLEMANETSKNKKENLGDRWYERFEKVLYKEVLNGATYPWVDSWTADGVPFQNCYMLRDFKYCDDKVYLGYKEQHRETRLKYSDVEIDGERVNFYKNLRDSFIESKSAKKFFKNPALSWDLANSINNDGSLYIIENLAIAAPKLRDARNEDFSKKTKVLTKRVRDLMAEYYHSDDIDKILSDRVKKSRKIIRNLDDSFGADNYYFGHLISSLQVSEPEIAKSLHSMLESSSVLETVNSSDAYEMLRTSVGLDKCSTVEEMKEKFMDYYGFDDEEEMMGWMKRKNYDPEGIFKLNVSQRSIASVLAKGIFDLWKDKVTSPMTHSSLTTATDFDSVAMTLLLEDIVACAEEVDITGQIQRRIDESTDTSRVPAMKEQEDFLADVIASEINNYVNDLGYHYRGSAYEEKLHKVLEQRGLEVFWDRITNTRDDIKDEVDLTNLFNSLSNNTGALIPSLTFNYYKWQGFVVASFVGSVTVGDYDIAANNALKALLDQMV